MKIQRSWILSVLASLTLLAAASTAGAQGFPYPAAPTGPAPGMNGAPMMMPPGMPPGMMPGMPPGMPPQGMPPGGFMPGPYGPGMPPGMPPGVYPANFQDPNAPGMVPPPMAPLPMPEGGMPMDGAYPGYMDGYMGGGYADGGYVEGGYVEGGYGSGYFDPGHNDFDIRLMRWLLPYGAGGICEPRWFDISADFLFMRREDVSRFLPFTSDGIGGPIVLGTDDLDFPEEPGFRATAAMQLTAGNSLEATYMGGFNWASRAAVTGTNNLYSVVSDFGLTPPTGFDDTDEGSYQDIAYSTAFHSVEANYRQRWTAPNCRVQGSWLLGARFFELQETFTYRTVGRGGDMDYEVGTYNALTGAQVGGDLWISIVPGLRIGAEGKAGLYGIRAQQGTRIDASSIGVPVLEDVSKNEVALLGEANLVAIWRVSHRWTFRGGYEFLYLDGVALADENFNAGPPFVANARTPTINVNGDAFYHGFYAGFEWMW